MSSIEELQQLPYGNTAEDDANLEMDMTESDGDDQTDEKKRVKWTAEEVSTTV